MKNSLLALALFAFVGTATAHDTPAKPGKGKTARKETCTRGMAGGCCLKGGAKATAATTPKAPATATKSL